MDNLIFDLQQARVLNFEMEAACVFTLASLFGLRSGSVCTVFANRSTNEFRVTGEDRAILAASEAVRILTNWDGRKQEGGKAHFYPSLA